MQDIYLYWGIFTACRTDKLYVFNSMWKMLLLIQRQLDEQTDSPRHHSELLLLQESSLLRVELPLLGGQDAFIRAENTGVKHSALPGAESTDRAHGVDQETANHVVMCA